MTIYQHPTEKAFLYYQKNSKKIYMSYYDNRGKRVQQSTKKENIEEAKIELQHKLFLLKAERDGQITIKQNSTSSVSNLANQVREDILIRKKPATTYKEIARKLKLIAETFGDLDIKQLSRKEMKILFNEELSKPQLSYLKSAFKLIFETAEDEGYISTFPPFPRSNIKKFEKSRFPISQAQWLKLHDFLFNLIENETNKLRRENRFLLLCAMILLKEAGPRIGEIRQAKVKDIKEEEVDGKINNILVIRVSKTLTRHIIIPESVMIAIQQLKRNKRPDDYLFSRSYDGKIPDFTQVLQSIRKHHIDFFKENDLENFVLYNLRHTFITEKIKEGKNLFFISQHCGTSLEMIQKHYAAYIVANNASNVYTEKDNPPPKSIEELRKEAAEKYKNNEL